MLHYIIIASLLSQLSDWSNPDPVYALEKLNPQINTVYDEINPVVSIDGKTMYFTRVGHPAFDKTLPVNDDNYFQTLTFSEYRQTLKDIFISLGDHHATDPVSSPFNQDIWIAASDQATFDRVEHPPYPLNSALPNSVCAVTTDPSTVVIVNQFFKDGSMLKGFSFAKKDGEEWQFPEPLFIYDYYNLEPGVNLNLSKDNEVMILSMNKHDSHGRNDLYVSFRIHTTLWSAPIHMGTIINSSLDELTPFISDDKQHLFFSSNIHGDQDIYVSERLDDSWTKWSKPAALPAPINSDADEAQPFLNRLTGYLYFTSTRDGSSDIYRVKFSNPTAKETPRPRSLVRKEEIKSDPSKVRCFVVDGTTSEPIKASLSIEVPGNGGVSSMALVGADGIFLDLPESGVLSLTPECQGYIGRKMKFDLSKLPSESEGKSTLKIPMDPLKVNTPLSIDPIFFIRGKDQILSGSYPELDRISKILRQHSNLHIRIDGHTDNVGDDWALIELSQKRAVAVKRYLVKSGIQSFRIKTRGYGPKRPVTNNQTEALRAKNRRVELVITKT